MGIASYLETEAENIVNGKMYIGSSKHGNAFLA